MRNSKGQFFKGFTPWNKNLTKETDERLIYFRPTVFKKGEHRSPETEFKKGEMSEKQKGENNSGWKDGISLEVKYCIDCGKKLGDYTAKRCRKCSEKFRIGKNHWNWQDGKSFELYGKEFNKQLKEQIRTRDNFTCQECGFTEQQLGYTLVVHHIDYNKKNNNFNNLITLCRSCHLQTNYQREDWTNYFKNKIKC